MSLPPPDTGLDSEIHTYEVVDVFGNPYEKLIARDDKPLDANDARKEEEKFQKHYEEAKKKSENGKTSAKEDKEQRELTDALMAMMKFTLVGEDSVKQAAFRDGKADYNDIVWWPKGGGWKNQSPTPNVNTRYIYFFCNTKQDGPVVVELPTADTALDLEEGAITVGAIVNVAATPTVTFQLLGPAAARLGT